MDPHDPTVIAETELLSAANSIEAAAKKLSLLQPRQRPKVARNNIVRLHCIVFNNYIYHIILKVSPLFLLCIIFFCFFISNQMKV